jgi:branched-chain amino acid transport system ATP-binding protein
VTGGALRLEGVTAGYGRATVLRDVTLNIPPASIVALLGPNGAGKTTLLRVASGVIKPTAGDIFFGERNITKEAPSARVRSGVCLIPEGRGIFRNMTVRENLLLQIPPWLKNKSIGVALDIFPPLAARLNLPAGRLSGGQQQMLALARAYLASAQVVMLDEVSMGLAPIVVEQIFQSLRTLADTGTSLLVVEQYVNRALEMSDHVYLLNHGAIVFSGAPSELDEEAVVRSYLGHELGETTIQPRHA